MDTPWKPLGLPSGTVTHTERIPQLIDGPEYEEICSSAPEYVFDEKTCPKSDVFNRITAMATIDDFTEGSILRKLVSFMLPILGALVLQAMYGAVDVLVVGWFGTTEGLSGVSTGSSIINLVTFVLTGLASSITVIIANCIGQKRPEEAGKVIGASIAFFAVIGVVLTFVLFAFAEPIARLMKAPPEALDNTVSYVRICGCGILFIIAYNVIACIFRGLGNSRLPLIFVAIACIVNIVGDYILIAIFHMDQAGAAAATVFAQAVSVVLSLLIMKREKLPFTVRRKDIRFGSQLGRILRIGSPMALQEFLVQLSFLALIAFINNIGLTASSGYGVANKIVSFVMLIPSSIMQSLASFISQNVGAGLEKRAQKTMYIGMGLGSLFGIVMFIAAFFCGDAISSVFTSDSAVIARSAEYLKGFAPEAIVTCVLFSFMGYFTGHSKTLFVMLQSIAQTFIVRLPFAYIASIQPDPSLTAIGLAAPAATVFGIIINAVYYQVYRKQLAQNAALEE